MFEMPSWTISRRNYFTFFSTSYLKDCQFFTVSLCPEYGLSMSQKGNGLLPFEKINKKLFLFKDIFPYYWFNYFLFNQEDDGLSTCRAAQLSKHCKVVVLHNSYLGTGISLEACWPQFVLEERTNITNMHQHSEFLFLRNKLGANIHTWLF